MHLTQLGIEINGDSGALFNTAVFVVSGVILWIYKKDIPVIGHKLTY